MFNNWYNEEQNTVSFEKIMSKQKGQHKKMRKVKPRQAATANNKQIFNY